MQKFKIGILDFGYRKKNTSGAAVLNDVFEYSLLADQLGFSSYWLSEHHNSGQGWSNPEIIIPLIAGYTSRINVGAAGILLAAHSPYRVALNFKLLENLFPGRIDLGLANGFLDDGLIERLLENKVAERDITEMFNRKVKDLLAYFKNDTELWENKKVMIPPFNGTFPRIWKLSTSFNGLEESVRQQMHYSKSMFHTVNQEPVDKARITKIKENHFQLNGVYPRINIAFSGICDENGKAAKRTFSLLEVKNDAISKNFIVGCPSYFKERLSEIFDQTGINEFVFYDQTLNYKKRMRALELIAKEFDL